MLRTWMSVNILYNVIDLVILSYEDLRNAHTLEKKPLTIVANMGTNYVRKWWETDLEDYRNSYNVDRFEILEYWGNIDKDMAEEAGLEIPDEFNDVDTIQINCWFVIILYYV